MISQKLSVQRVIVRYTTLSIVCHYAHKGCSVNTLVESKEVLETTLRDVMDGDVREMVELACQEAAWYQAETVQPEHLLLGILESNDDLVTTALRALNVNLTKLTADLNQQLPAIISSTGTVTVFSQAVQRAFRHAHQEMQLTMLPALNAVHLLAGLLYEEHGLVADVARRHGLDLFKLREWLLTQRASLDAQPMLTPNTVRALNGAIRPSWVFGLCVLIMLGSGGVLWFDISTIWPQGVALLFVISGWIVSVCLHEFGHALAAYRGGDVGVRSAGYLTLNPLKYTHPALSIVMPVVFILLGGIGLPGGAVYINTPALRNRRWKVLVALAGPAMSALFGLLIISPFWFNSFLWRIPVDDPFWAALALLSFLQITAVVFNLIPLPPLDGFQAIAPWLPVRLRDQLFQFGTLIMIGIYIILWQDNPITRIFWRFIFSVADALGIPLPLIGAGLDLF